MFCGNCGSSIKEGAKYCPNCGWAVPAITESSVVSIGDEIAEQEEYKPIIQEIVVSKEQSNSTFTAEPIQKVVKKQLTHRRIAIAVIGILVLGIGAGGYIWHLKSNAAKAEALITSGNEHMDKFELDAAIADFSSAIHFNSKKFPKAFEQRGWAYIFKGEYDLAVADFDQLIKNDSNNAYSYYSRGIAYSYRGEDDKAITDFDKAVQINPNYSAPYYEMGRIHYGKMDYYTAISDYGKALAIDSNNESWLNSRAFTYFYLGRYSEALSDADKAISINPRADNIYDTRGTIYRAMENYQKAIADYDESIRISPNNAIYWMNRSIAYRWSGNNSAADYNFNHAVEIDPKGASEAWVDIGINWYQSGFYADAVRAFNNALDLNLGNQRILDLRDMAQAKAH